MLKKNNAWISHAEEKYCCWEPEFLCLSQFFSSYCKMSPWLQPGWQGLMAFLNRSCVDAKGFPNNRVNLLSKASGVLKVLAFWPTPEAEGLMMIWQASFDLEKQQWDSQCLRLLRKLLCVLLPETSMSSQKARLSALKSEQLILYTAGPLQSFVVT